MRRSVAEDILEAVITLRGHLEDTNVSIGVIVIVWGICTLIMSVRSVLDTRAGPHIDRVTSSAVQNLIATFGEEVLPTPATVSRDTCESLLRIR